ncbi:ABC transporter ATP-binding protein [Bariatricus massiliensis]|uniref:ABC transporter ATP-binding protein n=1 Tax=Bariatricus massiliensis TaxID=1745713 RepID=A0ABS8DEL1_9FIRM|nr:ABC transporter ATP-binding protein [Bariatricus massiliensis]MCB7302964.1 ABC transporter ATP-binding protein [Bariatricus massiliensis]MCB7374180.1 ABC transporter ATP-binding protein [Bariatricus massiliensis]MCB7386850.1 ABC transporter ATP-binding protein [Bariatricus massiliensis]MCB7411012.1 ABC transporter ATP-binding protein [Bariatricus massiliensis]MCQ5251838.1 ABC transporter ATP-binding protein [Bariatricus massiliensis]
MCILKVEHVSYSYRTKYQTIEAVKDVSCEFEAGNLYAITGESGSGKSTLLSLLAGLDLPLNGRILVKGEDMAEIDRDKYRREQASVVYQAFHLFPLLNTVENIMFPMELKGIPKKQAEEKAKQLIAEVGLAEQSYRQFPQMMSGGEQQRVAIARAFAAGGQIILADEPTGNLDSENEENIVKLLRESAHERGYAVIVITHNPEVAAQADVILTMRDGRLIGNTAQEVGVS